MYVYMLKVLHNEWNIDLFSDYKNAMQLKKI